MLHNTGWKKSTLPQTYLDLIFIPIREVSVPTIKKCLSY